MAANTFPGLGPGDAAPILNAQWNPAGIDLTPEHYFVLTRVDGRTPLKQIVLISGFGEDKAVAILRKLKDSGAIYFPGEAPGAGGKAAARAAPATTTPTAMPPPTDPPTMPPPGKRAGTANPAPPAATPGANRAATANPATPAAMPGANRAPSAATPGANRAPSAATPGANRVGVATPPTRPPGAPKPVAMPSANRVATVRPEGPPPNKRAETDRPIGTADTLKPGVISGNTTGASQAITYPPRPPDPNTKIDERLLDEECDLSVEQKRAILIKQASLKNATLFDVLELPPDADKRALKRAYFKISKDFHPDRYYGKNLGTYRARLDEIFALATKAFEHLDDDGRRAAYADTLATSSSPDKPSTVPPAGQSPAARAAELFDLACQHQVTGDTKRALQEFAAAIRLDPQARYLRRASEAALRAQELRSAEEYATKAAELDPRDAGTQRMLAKVHRAMGRLDEARAELERAKRLDPGNRYIAAELDEVMAELAKR